METGTPPVKVRWMFFIGLVGAITVAGYFVLYPQTLFKPGAKLFDLGYNLGLAGGLMMLAMLLYPLRKRVKRFNNVGSLPNWFKWHMVLGILGPMIIIFHSTYHVYIPYFHPTGSPNSAIAMFSMLLVSGSGTFGRFFYTKIHLGLYGRQATVNDLRAELEKSGDVESLFSFAPDVDKSLTKFSLRAEEYARRSDVGFIPYLTIGFQTSFLTWLLSRRLHNVMLKNALQNNFTSSQRADMEESFLKYKKQIAYYFMAQRDAVQFHTYERMFSWWHILHIPLVYLMVFSGFYHVYAVHFY